MTRTPGNTEIEQFVIDDASEKNMNQLTVAQTATDMANAIALNNFEAIEAIGAIKAAAFIETVSGKVLVESLIKVREGKKYKGLPYFDEDKKRRSVSTFDEFCEVFLGKSGRRARDLINNYNQLGPDLYEQAEKLGFRQRDYNALKALPDDDKKIIAQAIEGENLDKALDLMQEMAAKHYREKESAAQKIETLQKELEASAAVIVSKDEHSNKLDKELNKLKIDYARKPFTDWPAAFAGYFAYLEENRHELKRRIAMLEIIRGDAFKIEPKPGEEAMLEQAQKTLADELVEMHNQCAEHLESIGLLFDKTLGAYSDKRINWIAQLCQQ